jgi:threonine dehydrogenase-like Zn-dependent dehydrogenase
MAQPFAVALHAIKRGRVDASETLVVIGVGGIGALIVAGAAGRGVKEIIAVDVDEKRLMSARELGATETINATDQDAVDAVRDLTGGDGAHVAIEASGTPAAPGEALRMVQRGGRVVILGLQPQPVALDLFDVALREIEITSALAHVCAQDLPEALDILAATDIAEKIVDRVIPLERLVEDGLVPLAERRAGGKILVDPQR